MTDHTPLTDGWPSPGFDAAAQVGAAAEQAQQTLALARGLATGGRAVSLSGLDRSVGVLCAKVLDLPLDEGRARRMILIELLSELDALGATLRAGAP